MAVLSSFVLSCKAVTCMSRSSSVGIATAYRLDDHRIEVQAPVTSRIFTSPYHLHRLWGHPASYRMGAGGSFPGGGESSRGVKLTTHLQLVLRSRKRGSIYSLPYTPSWYSAQLVRDSFWCTMCYRKNTGCYAVQSMLTTVKLSLHITN
jgi:hypothetical protein